jgi:hypothetical protein
MPGNTGHDTSADRSVGKALRSCLQKLASADAAPDAEIGTPRFLECWKTHVGLPAIRQNILDVAEKNDPDIAVWQIAAVVQALRFPRPNQLSSADALLKDLLLAVALAVSDRLVRQRAVCPDRTHCGVEVPMADQLAAAVVASAWLDVPLTIRYDPVRKAPYPANVIDDCAPLEFGTDEGSALGVMRQELQAFLARHFAQSFVKPGMSVQSLLAGLRQLRASHGLAPVVALRHGELQHPLSEASRREAFIQRFGVPVFAYGAPGASTDMQELEADLLNHLQNSLHNLFQTHSEESPAMPSRTKVFISYAHEDEAWREMLRKALTPQERKNLLDIWDDRRIGTGDDWHKEIDGALQSCRIAILLVTMDFLASGFINDVELTSVFDRHEKAGLWIYPILIGPCDWEGEDKLKAKQMKTVDGEPIELAAPALQKLAFAQIAKEIRERLEAGAV